MTNRFQIPNRDFMIWALEFCRSTLPHYTHKLMGSGYKPEPAWSRGMFTLNSYHLTGLEDQLKLKYMTEWSIVAQWNPEARYKPIGIVKESDAKDMLDSAKELIKQL